MAAQAAADAMPANVVAHRLGDYVFTYHGIDSTAADPQLWIVIKSNDPAQNPFNDPNERIAVGLTDGTTTRHSAPRFAAALADQNALRASLGLPPLPIPSQVLHDAPAVAP
jgi:hypothetical protein